MTDVQKKPRGRPPKGERALTQAEHKREQRTKLREAGGRQILCRVDPRLRRFLEEFAIVSGEKTLGGAARLLLESALLGVSATVQKAEEMREQGRTDDEINQFVVRCIRAISNPVEIMASEGKVNA